MRIARTIITFDCPQDCDLCCNKYAPMQRLMTPCSLEDLRVYDQVLITGGEPMLYPKEVIRIARALRNQSPDQTIYLYTALHTHRMKDILPHVDGVHFTIHKSATRADVERFYKFQNLIRGWNKSFRLYLEPGIDKPIKVIPNRWTRVEVKPWLQEHEMKLPRGESLLVLKG